MDIQDKTIGIAPVGCAVFAYNYIDIDWQEAAHDEHRLWQLPLKDYCPIVTCLPIKEMAI
jgi:hypothetical protein